MKILIVDDETAIRMIIRQSLDGHEIQESSNPLEALQLFHTFKPDLVITDYDMKTRENGVWLTEEIRKVSDGTTIFMFSASNVEEQFKLKKGDAFFSKPGLDGLLSQIEQREPWFKISE